MRILSPWHDWLVEPLSRAHLVHFYEDDGSLAASVATYVGAGLRKGESAVMVTTPENAAAVRARLSAERLDTADLERWGQLRILNARDVLEELLAVGLPDRDRFQLLSNALISDARQASRNGRVRLYGDMVNLLWGRNLGAAALQLESLWTETCSAGAVPLLCAYRFEAASSIPARLCEIHTHVVPLQACA